MRLIDVNGNQSRGRRAKQIHVVQDASLLKDPQRLAEAVARLDSRVSTIESRATPDSIEFDVTCPASGTISLNHGFKGPIRWYVTSWRRKTNAGTYSLSELTPAEGTTLTLTSKAAGQAVIRVESVQPGQALRSSSSADATQNLAGGTTIAGNQYDIVESDGAGGVQYLAQSSGAASKWVKYGASGPTYEYQHSGSQYDVPYSDGAHGWSFTTQASGSANKVLTWGATGPTWGVQAGRWTTVYDLDFTALTLSTVTGNGNFTIDGKTWTVANFAKANTMSVGGSDGLRIKCTTASSSMAAGTNSSAYFMSPAMSTLLPSLPDDVRIGLRFSFYTPTFTRNVTNDALCILLCDSTLDATRFEFEQFNNAGTQTDYMRLYLASVLKVNTNISATMTSPSTHNAIQLEFGQLGIDIPNIFSTGVYASGFTNKWYRRAQCSAAAGQYINPAIRELGDARLVIAQIAGSAAGTAEFKMSRMLVEYYLYN